MTVRARFWEFVDRPEVSERERTILIARSCGVRIGLLAVALEVSGGAIDAVTRRAWARLRRIHCYETHGLAPVLLPRRRK